MAELNGKQRFIYALNTNWYGSDNGKANEELYSNSVVFIHDASGKGLAIWAQGSYFEMNNNTDVKNIIDTYVKGTGNIVVEVKDGNLTISETSVDSLTGKTDSTALVQAKAVAGALTTPVALTMSLSDETGAAGDGTKATFSETFTTLDGKTTEAVTTVLKEGSNITFTKDTDGLVISAATFNVPSASASDYGVIKVSSVNTTAVTVNSESTTAGRYYPVELNSDGKAIVNVPWVDTNTDTHHQAKNVVSNSASGTSETSSNLTNGNVYLNLIENGTKRSSHKIQGINGTIVTYNASTDTMEIDWEWEVLS